MIGGTEMSENAAFEGGRNWVGIPHSQGCFLYVFAPGVKKKRAPGLHFFRQLKILSAAICSKPHTKTNYGKLNSFCSESPLKKGNGSKCRAVLPQRHPAAFHPVAISITLRTNTQ